MARYIPTSVHSPVKFIRRPSTISGSTSLADADPMLIGPDHLALVLDFKLRAGAAALGAFFGSRVAFVNITADGTYELFHNSFLLIFLVDFRFFLPPGSFLGCDYIILNCSTFVNSFLEKF